MHLPLARNVYMYVRVRRLITDEGIRAGYRILEVKLVSANLKIGALLRLYNGSIRITIAAAKNSLGKCPVHQWRERQLAVVHAIFRSATMSASDTRDIVSLWFAVGISRW